MRIIADTATLFAPSEGAAQSMTIVPVSVAINDRTYQDYTGISREEFLAAIAAGGVPTSSQPAVGDLLDAFESGDEEMLVLTVGGLAAAVGHCRPIFAKFRGGKAVAAMYGFLFGLFVCVGYSPLVFFLPLAVFTLLIIVRHRKNIERLRRHQENTITWM